MPRERYTIEEVNYKLREAMCWGKAIRFAMHLSLGRMNPH